MNTAALTHHLESASGRTARVVYRRSDSGGFDAWLDGQQLCEVYRDKGGWTVTFPVNIGGGFPTREGALQMAMIYARGWFEVSPTAFPVDVDRLAGKDMGMSRRSAG